MAISIKVGSTSGVNVNDGADNYLDAMPSMFDPGSNNFGYFYKSLTNATAYGLAELKEGPVFSGGSALLAKGLLSYDIITHELVGSLDAISFGEELNGLSGGFGQTTTKMSLGRTDVSFAGLGLSDADGDDVNGIIYGMMTGDATKFLEMLATTAVKFTGGTGRDSYIGGSKADVLHGDGGRDVLGGGGGNDKIFGDAGADSLSGGAGKDQFIFASVKDSTAAQFDTIGDFNGKSGDRINLSAIDANGGKPKFADFDFIGQDDFGKIAGELRFEKSLQGTDIHADINGDGLADFTIHLASNLNLRESDFVF